MAAAECLAPGTKDGNEDPPVVGGRQVAGEDGEGGQTVAGSDRPLAVALVLGSSQRLRPTANEECADFYIQMWFPT